MAQLLEQAAHSLSNRANTAQQQSGEQSRQMEMEATAINEVAYSVQDFARNAEHASN